MVGVWRARGDGREGKGGRAGGSTVEKREMTKLPFLFFLVFRLGVSQRLVFPRETTIFLVVAAAAPAAVSRWRFAFLYAWLPAALL